MASCSAGFTVSAEYPKRRPYASRFARSSCPKPNAVDDGFFAVGRNDDSR